MTDNFQPPIPELRPEPQPGDFLDEDGYEDRDRYYQELAKWGGEKGVIEYQQRQEQARLEKQGRDFVDRIAKKYPDFPELLEKSNPSPTVAAFVMKSKNSEAVAYHLVRHPAENERLSALDPFEAGIEIGKLDSQLSNGNLAAAPTGGAPALAPKGFPANPTKISATEYAQHHPACPSWLKQKNG
jgi:hypothetical protein